jgi:hypothetical protein
MGFSPISTSHPHILDRSPSSLIFSSGSDMSITLSYNQVSAIT